jgi:hypothetical protein
MLTDPTGLDSQIRQYDVIEKASSDQTTDVPT